MCLTLFLGGSGNNAMLLISALPSYILFAIEIIRLRDQGFTKYFGSGGITDFLNFFAFNGLLIIKFSGMESNLVFVPEIKVMMMITGFLKLLFFVRIFEDFGFLA